MIHFIFLLPDDCYEKKTPWNPGVESKFHELNTYIEYAYIFII